MQGRLTIYFPDRPVRSIVLHPDRQYRLGRDPSCDIHVNDNRISRVHAAFAFRGERWHCRDAGSKNGTRVDGRAVSESALPQGAWIDIGGLLAQFTTVNERERLTEQVSVTERRQHVAEAKQRIERAPGVRQLLDELLDSIIALGGMQRAFLMLRDERDDFELATVRHFVRKDFEAAVFSGSLAAVREALAAQRAVVICDVAGVTRLANRPSVAAGGIRALICLPLRLESDVGGVIYADSRVPGKVFSELDMDILDGLAEHAALALAAVAVREQIDGLARGVREPAASTSARHAVLSATRIAVRELSGAPALTLGELLRGHLDQREEEA